MNIEKHMYTNFIENFRENFRENKRGKAESSSKFKSYPKLV